jgi:hypothetical protein
VVSTPRTGRTTTLAAVAGGLVGGALGYVVGFLVVSLVEPDGAGLDWIGYWLVGGALGMWAGATTGIGIGLRLAGRPPASSPIFWATVALLPLGGGGAWLGLSFNDYDDNMPLAVEYGIPVVAVGLAIYFGTWMARRFQN